MKDPLIEIPVLEIETAQERYFSTAAFVIGYNSGAVKFGLAYENPAKYGRIHKGFTIPILNLEDYDIPNSDWETEFVSGWLSAVSKLYVLNYNSRTEEDRLRIAMRYLLRDNNVTKRFSETTGKPTYAELKFTVQNTHDIEDEIFKQSIQDLEMHHRFNIRQTYGLIQV
ncbi:hypothetical protein [Stenotrophomonas phage YB07]|uniref:Uncharacterized protein n=1 Tax=Stenotrophomonas phage YB07 TaxID=2555548 RepID=A0A482IDL9_9CAUD|nr:hypothetical protein HWC11_gp067 [Stenotrophomonas phage YB07]QBP06263.1 hypothetical protein [Stenotrophomonas phage YB07]